MKFLLFSASFFLCFSISAYSQTSIYSLSIDSLGQATTISLSAFQGKKILIVNTASQDSSSWQYSELAQLSNQFADSLAIIAVPSNDFSTEPFDDASMAGFYQQSQANGLSVATKSLVTGDNMHPLYQWLTQQAQNNVMDSQVKAPFQKYLISPSGQLIGVFNKGINPMNTILINAISSSNNN